MRMTLIIYGSIFYGLDYIGFQIVELDFVMLDLTQKYTGLMDLGLAKKLGAILDGTETNGGCKRTMGDINEY